MRAGEVPRKNKVLGGTATKSIEGGNAVLEAIQDGAGHPDPGLGGVGLGGQHLAGGALAALDPAVQVALAVGRGVLAGEVDPAFASAEVVPVARVLPGAGKPDTVCWRIPRAGPCALRLKLGVRAGKTATPGGCRSKCTWHKPLILL